MTIRLIPIVLAFALVLSAGVAQAQSDLTDYARASALPAPSEAPSAPSKATPTSPQTTFGGLTFFTDRPTFTAATGPLPTESFEDSTVPLGDIIGCGSTLNSATNDACYSPGAVIDGFTLNTFGDADDTYATAAPGGLGSPSTIVGPVNPNANAELLFPGSPTAVGFDLSAFAGAAPFTIEVFGADGSLGSTVVNAPVVSTGGTFVGVTSMTPITRITISDPVGTSQLEFQLIDNLAFGTIPPAADLSLSIDDFGVSVAPGDGIVYTLRAANAGPQVATAIVFTTVVPAHTTFDAAASSSWTCSDGAPATATCTLDFGAFADIGVGGTANVTFAVVVDPVIPPGVSEISLSASVANAAEVDPNSADNADTELTPLITTVTFSVDGSLLGLLAGEVLALRGDTAPLSFEESFPLADPDGDGIWTGTVDFAASLAGQTLEYKFVRHSDTQYDLPAGDLGIAGGFEGDVGDGDNGNRVLVIPAEDTALDVVFFNNDNGCDGVPRITSQVLDTDVNTVTVTFEDGDGLTEINFINRDTGQSALNNLFVSQSGGFESADGVLWTPTPTTPETAVFVLQQENTSIPQAGFFALITDGCAAGPEVYYADPILQLGTDATAAVPVEFGLAAAYPNPFGGSAARTVVPVDVAEASEVRVVVYDVLGRSVATLLDGPLEAGRYEAVLEAAGLPAGTYLVRMTATGATAGAFSQTQRLTLLR